MTTLLESPQLLEVDARTERAVLSDGAETTIHTATYPLGSFTVEVADTTLNGQPDTLLGYAKRTGRNELINGGFFLNGLPMGEVWHNGTAIPHRPFPEHVASERGTIYVDAQHVLQFDRRKNLPAQPQGELLSAGPLLVHKGASCVAGVRNPEGYLTTADDHDEYINSQRHPRAAIGITTGKIVCMVVDGRSSQDAGMYLDELADYGIAQGVKHLLNLDGGGTSTLISGGKMLNVSRNSATGINPEGRRTHTGLAIVPKPQYA